jgi:hypothetical protein
MNDGATAALRRTVRLPGGQAALHDAWVNLAAATLVQQTRFDPLHDQRQEAQLREQLPQLATEAQRTGQGHCMIEAGGSTLPLTLTRDQLVTAASGWLQPLAAALQSLSAAIDDCVLLVPESMLNIPGLNEALVTARFASLFSFADGAAARAASLLPATAVTSSGGVQYLLRVPVFTAAAAAQVLVPLQLRDSSGAAAATHLIYNGRALPIPPAGLIIGRDPGDAFALRLPEGIAGLSRRHCTLRHDGVRTQVVDHSTFGSYVDGVRVRGRALLSAGSVLRLGEPGIELPLITLAGMSGTCVVVASKSSACPSWTASAAASARWCCSTPSLPARPASSASAPATCCRPRSTGWKKRCWSARATSWCCAIRCRRPKPRRRSQRPAPAR